jgi:hypothetical protein
MVLPKIRSLPLVNAKQNRGVRAHTYVAELLEAEPFRRDRDAALAVGAPDGQVHLDEAGSHM